MKSPLRVVHLEDDARDAALVRETLAAEGIVCEVRRVETLEDFVGAVEGGGFDLILADYALPSFDGLSALKIAQDRSAHLPFIFVSATLDEEIAVEALKIGARDYVFKTRLARLAPSVRRALLEAEERADLGRAEAALRDSERSSRLIVDNIPGLVALLTATGDVEMVNRQVFEYFGRTLDELRHWGTNDTIHPEDLAHVIDVFRRAIASGSPYEVAQRFRRADGVYRWFTNRGFPVRAADGQITRWCVLLTDIDERKRAEDALRESERESRLIVDSIPGIVAVLSARGDVEFVNRQACEYFGKSLDELKHWESSGMTHPEDIPRVMASFTQAISSGTPFDFEFRARRFDGVFRWCRSRGLPLHDANGQIVRWYSLLLDIDERRRAEEAVDKARSELAHVARIATVNALTASIAHEINQPVTGIVTNAGTCLRLLDADPPDLDGARHTATRMIRDANRTAEVIARLRALFSKQEFTLEPLNLSDVTREVIALTSIDLQRGRVALEAELADDLPIIDGDRIQLQQVILNLLRNAVDAMSHVHERARGLLIKTEREDAGYVRLSVRDAGVGIDREHMDKLFTAFHTTKPGGMGIGLSISRSIVERHQGRLWAEPNDGPGVTFAFAIPVPKPSST